MYGTNIKARTNWATVSKPYLTAAQVRNLKVGDIVVFLIAPYYDVEPLEYERLASEIPAHGKRFRLASVRQGTDPQKPTSVWNNERTTRCTFDALQGQGVTGFSFVWSSSFTTEEEDDGRRFATPFKQPGHLAQVWSCFIFPKNYTGNSLMDAAAKSADQRIKTATVERHPGYVKVRIT